jgi:hypothetical protein
MGLTYNTYLNSSRIYGCKTCKSHLANHEDIISRVRFPLSLCFLLLPPTHSNPTNTPTFALQNRTSAASTVKRTSLTWWSTSRRASRRSVT